jgi:hypothetical protein
VPGTISAGLPVDLAGSAALGADIFANAHGIRSRVIARGRIVGVGMFHVWLLLEPLFYQLFQRGKGKILRLFMSTAVAEWPLSTTCRLAEHQV